MNHYQLGLPPGAVEVPVEQVREVRDMFTALRRSSYALRELPEPADDADDHVWDAFDEAHRKHSKVLTAYHTLLEQIRPGAWDGRLLGHRTPALAARDGRVFVVTTEEMSELVREALLGLGWASRHG